MTAQATRILFGVAGSHAHGLATEHSDQDYLGTFSYPTDAFWSLQKPAESIVAHEPDDMSTHELEKFMRLASKANPTVLELLGLDSYVEKEEYWGDRLINMKDAFFSQKYVHNAFLGYAESQFRKLAQRGDNFDSSVKNRTNKHARHLFRLIETGHRLYQTGVFQVRVSDPASYEKYNTMTVAEISDEFANRWGDFLSSETVLPEYADMDRINEYLYDYRKAH